ncbi:hypothetical protein GUITHDRAFT_150411 [Guillardia theta CCMP2712]|uniref:Uncharacterized protein n=1 Tax=Guillardia theta (strain CCMP2712) TaxID=905079 RepID=L1JZ05_GUITC|nr:hypothetical protein GUITHDRAFT_150411 [Guillardia theta CCMP2712]EKX53440.1 hypothetical protein GUITHDRAFT_150411 [Guillardia theta CCMP2712]|eukprot:XP_005840420.1 hypothetical protein GUITHDRAFT_150411 [Guillardia theta CCMP2712]
MVAGAEGAASLSAFSHAGSAPAFPGMDSKIAMRSSKCSGPMKLVCSQSNQVPRRAVLDLAISGAILSFTPAQVRAESEKEAKAAALGKQMKVVEFTRVIDTATDKAFKLAEKGKLKEAEEQWSIVIDKYRQGGDGVVVSPQAFYRLGLSLSKRADIRAQLGKSLKDEKYAMAAIQDYLDSIKIQDSPEIRVKLGTTYSILNRFSEAEEQFSSIIDKDFGAEIKSRALVNRGLMYQQQSKWESAAKDYQLAVELTKGSPEALKNLAIINFQIGQEEKSLEMLKNQKSGMILGVVEGAEDVPAALAAVKFAMGKEDEAKADFEKVQDQRFKDIRFVREGRLWPPKLVDALARLKEAAGQ